VTPIVRSDHKAVVAFPDRSHSALPKSRIERRFRRHTPAQHAQFLKHAVSHDFINPQPTASSDPSINAQAEFDHFYSSALRLLDQFYPETIISQTSRDPAHITPAIKAMLRRKNRLMRAGRVEEAGALAERIVIAIQLRCKRRLARFDGKTDAKSMWAAVRQLTGRQPSVVSVDGVTAETLNDHYTRLSLRTTTTPPRPASNRRC